MVWAVGHLERMDGDRLLNRMYRSKIQGVLERSLKRWKDGVTEALDKRVINLEQSAVSEVSKQSSEYNVDANVFEGYVYLCFVALTGFLP